MSLKARIIDKAFAGRKNVFQNVVEKTTTGAPANSIQIGTLTWNSYDGDAYIATDAAGTHVKINA